MHDKKEIGLRIQYARKNCGLTKVALAELTGLGASRLGNWEAGFRTPKLTEVKLLAKALKVPAAFLLGLAEEMEFKTIPLFTEADCKNLNTKLMASSIARQTLPLPQSYAHLLAEEAFAYQVVDDSMAPLLKKDTIVVFLPHKELKHNDWVLASIKGITEPMIRRFFWDTSNVHDILIQLMSQDEQWPTITIRDRTTLIVHGVMSGLGAILF